MNRAYLTNVIRAAPEQSGSQLTDDGRRDYRDLVRGPGWEQSSALVRLCVPPLLDGSVLNQIGRLTARLGHICLWAPEAGDAGSYHPAPESQRHQNVFLGEERGTERPVVAVIPFFQRTDSRKGYIVPALIFSWSLRFSFLRCWLS